MTWMRASITAIGLLLLAACASTTEPSGSDDTNLDLLRGLAGTPAAQPVSLLFVESISGDLEPCGCPGRPLGGVVRLAKALDGLALSAKQKLFLSPGRLYVPHVPIRFEANLASFKVKGEALTEALNQVGLDVVSPSHADFAMGLDWLRQMQKKAKFKFVSANLYDRSTGKPAFDRTAEFTFGGKKVVVTGISRAVVEPLPYDLKTDWREPAEELASVLATVPEDAFVVLLSDLPSDERTYLVERFPRIRVILGSDGILQLERPIVYGATTLALAVPLQGKTLGVVSTALGSPSQPFFSESHASLVRHEIEWRTKVIDRFDRAKKSKKRSQEGIATFDVAKHREYVRNAKLFPTAASSSSLDFSGKAIDLTDAYDSPTHPLQEVVKGYKERLGPEAAEAVR